MTIADIRKMVDADSAPMTKEQVDEALDMFMADAGGKYDLLPLYEFFYAKLGMSKGIYVDEKCHIVNQKYLLNLGKTMPSGEQYESAFVPHLLVNEALYYLMVSTGRESLPYINRVLDSGTALPKYSGAAVSYAFNIFFNANLPNLTDRYIEETKKLLAGTELLDEHRIMLQITLLDAYAGQGKVEEYLNMRNVLTSAEFRPETREILSNLVRVHIFATSLFSGSLFPDLSESWVVREFREILDILHSLAAIADCMSYLMLPALRYLGEQLPEEELVRNTKRIIEVSPNINDKLAFYSYLIKDRKIDKGKYADVLGEYYSLLEDYYETQMRVNAQSLKNALAEYDLQQQYKQDAMVDELTGLGSRHAYNSRLHELQTKGSRLPEKLIMVIADVNGLKTVNDNFGHTEGDRLLTAAGDVLNTCFSPYGKVYRIGGDEFAIIAETEPRKMNDAIEALSALTEAHTFNAGYSLSISVGMVVGAEHPGESLNAMIRVADSRMYANKNDYYRRKGIDRRRH